MTIVTFPLSEEVFTNLENLDQSGYSVDVSKIDFGEDEDNIESAMIYIRNLQLSMPLDFTNVLYEEKSKWLIKYISLGIFAVEIKSLLETWLTILAGEDIEFECILTQEEIQKFKEENSDLVEDILSFLVSIDDIAVILVDNAAAKEIKCTTDLEIVKDTPVYFNTLLLLVRNYPIPIEAIRFYYALKVPHKIYDCLLSQLMKNNDWYEAIMRLPYIKLFGEICNAEEESND